ncbi:unnamed protein product [Heligmosomoides polygyrus]|uniref:THUMP domain-containing protein n=1 Tax=Heligmosomoides polygyrus TaxID=6339 RepID=A0A183G689_HELPZ|nr:unnamed protein product [Heligmosomoides polygyrus]
MIIEGCFLRYFCSHLNEISAGNCPALIEEFEKQYLKNSINGQKSTRKRKSRVDNDSDDSSSSKAEVIEKDIFDDGTISDSANARPSKAKEKKVDDSSYGICEGRKISRILGLNTTGSELRMLVVYSDGKKLKKKDAELIPSRILRHYAPQVHPQCHILRLEASTHSTALTACWL